MKASRIGTVGALLILALQSIAVLSLGLTFDGTALAQQDPPKPADGGGLDIDVSINEDNDAAMWYTQWWVWAVGVGVFLVVIIALTNRGGGSSPA